MQRPMSHCAVDRGPAQAPIQYSTGKPQRRDFLRGARVVLTGATSGIGAATAAALLDCGVEALGLIGRDDAAMRATRATHVAVADLADLPATRAAVSKLGNTMGGIDVLISNAGQMSAGLSTYSCSQSDWDAELRVNLSAPFVLLQAALPFLRRSAEAGRQPAVVLVSSICSHVAFENLLPYCVAKAGVDQLARCAALELGPRGVRVNAVNPGIIDTPLNRRAFRSDAAYADYLARSSDLHPVRRCGEARDVAHLILFLADSSASGFMTGQLHVIDGGRSRTVHGLRTLVTLWRPPLIPGCAPRAPQSRRPRSNSKRKAAARPQTARAPTTPSPVA